MDIIFNNSWWVFFLFSFFFASLHKCLIMFSALVTVMRTVLLELIPLQQFKIIAFRIQFNVFCFGRYKCEWTCLKKSEIYISRLGYCSSEFLVKFGNQFWGPPPPQQNFFFYLCIKKKKKYILICSQKFGDG
jgi:hypothetical protein